MLNIWIVYLYYYYLASNNDPRLCNGHLSVHEDMSSRWEQSQGGYSHRKAIWGRLSCKDPSFLDGGHFLPRYVK